MELKDVILSTLAEMDSDAAPEEDIADLERLQESVGIDNSTSADFSENEENGANEELWLENVRERLLVLFEGFQSPNNVQIEAKVDLSLNFLEYLLATIDTRLETIKGKKD